MQALEHRPERVDLLTLATLASWLENGLRRIGQRRLLVILEVYGSMGDMPDGLEEILMKLINLEPEVRERDEVPLRECLRTLAELDNLIWRSSFDGNGAAMLAIYLGDRRGTLADGLL